MSGNKGGHVLHDVDPILLKKLRCLTRKTRPGVVLLDSKLGVTPVQRQKWHWGYGCRTSFNNSLEHSAFIDGDQRGPELGVYCPPDHNRWSSIPFFSLKDTSSEHAYSELTVVFIQPWHFDDVCQTQNFCCILYGHTYRIKREKQDSRVSPFPPFFAPIVVVHTDYAYRVSNLAANKLQPRIRRMHSRQA